MERQLGVGRKQNSANLQSLFELADPTSSISDYGRLVYRIEEWRELTNDTYDSGNPQYPVRFYLNQLDAYGDNSYVWFAKTFAEGHKTFHRPLMRLKSLGEIPTRLLLALYLYHDMYQFGGVLPYEVSHPYCMTPQSVGKNGFALWHCAPSSDAPIFSPTFACMVLRISTLGETPSAVTQNLNLLTEALESLISAGFVYEVITVLDSPSGPNANVVQELDIKSGFGFKPKHEKGIGGKTARLAGYWQRPVSKTGARFHGVYAAIVAAGSSPACAGIYRLRFRVSNPKNYGVVDAFKRIRADQEYWETVLDGLIGEHE